MPDHQTILVFGAASLIGAALAVLLTGPGLRRALRGATGATRAGGPVFADTPRRYEFREGYLLSAFDPNDSFLPDGTDRSAAYATLARTLGPLDPALPGALDALARRGEGFLITARFGQDDLVLAGRAEDDRLVVTVGPTETRGGRQVIETAALEALRDEAEDLRAALDTAQEAIWREDAAGRVLWGNAAYLALAGRRAEVDAERPCWPLPALFAEGVAPLPEAGTARRHRLPDGGAGDGAAAGDRLWFEVTAERRADGGLVGTALPVDRLVAAETSLRNFVQTLSKTFAQLPVGLAVFDRRRELMLFNPALVTHSTLDPQFLSARPTLVAFLDALRDRQRMPEPKNYRAWRDEIARLEQDAEAGTYQDIWSLPDGQSFRVMGRPHPDGAVAFMFEDITSEISLTRRFRGELELYAHVLDDVPGALAVFGGDGRLALANAAFWTRWGGDRAADLGVLSLAEATRRWQAACAPSGAWGDIRALAGGTADRAAWSDEVVTAEGEPLLLRVAPLAGGAVSVGFHPQGALGTAHAVARRVAASSGPAAAFRSRRSAAG